MRRPKADLKEACYASTSKSEQACVQPSRLPCNARGLARWHDVHVPRGLRLQSDATLGSDVSVRAGIDSRGRTPGMQSPNF
jgi:hypothetical protein